MEIPWPGAFGTYTCLVHWNVNPIGWLWTDSATLTFRPVCDDPALNALVGEYYDSQYGVKWKPGCFDFINEPVNGPYHTFAQWMVDQGNQHQGWWPFDIAAFPNGVTYIQDWYGHPLRIVSGYRCPHVNATIEPKGAPDSRHQYGDAVDVKPTDQVWDKAERDYLEYIARNFAGATWIESWDETKTHLHADWR